MSLQIDIEKRKNAERLILNNALFKSMKAKRGNLLVIKSQKIFN